MPFSSTLLNEQPFSTTIAFYDAVHDALARAKADVDPKRLLGERPFVYAGNSFTWIMTEQALVANVLQGFAICFPVCFAILVVATGSPLISLYAIVTIALIVGLTLGFCQAIMGWGLGVAETVCSTIVIGFSVDYVVHLGHSYRESAHFSREGKVSDALTRMGITVVAGAMTTFGSGLFMFGCQMTFFTKVCATPRRARAEMPRRARVRSDGEPGLTRGTHLGAARARWQRSSSSSSFAQSSTRSCSSCRSAQSPGRRCAQAQLQRGVRHAALCVRGELRGPISHSRARLASSRVRLLQGEMKTIAGYAQELASWRRGEPHAAPRPLQAVPAPSSPGAQNSAPSTASTVSS